MVDFDAEGLWVLNDVAVIIRFLIETLMTGGVAADTEACDVDGGKAKSAGGGPAIVISVSARAGNGTFQRPPKLHIPDVDDGTDSSRC